MEIQVILQACLYCFEERGLYTQERLSVAIGQLLERPVVPSLFLRTVMHALALYPRLTGYVVNVLYRLILKRVRLASFLITSLLFSSFLFPSILLYLPLFVGFFSGMDELRAVERFRPMLHDDAATQLTGAFAVATICIGVGV